MSGVRNVFAPKFTFEFSVHINTRALLNSFLELRYAFDASRVFMWTENSKVNFGIMVHVEEVLELHYITVELT